MVVFVVLIGAVGTVVEKKVMNTVVEMHLDVVAVDNGVETYTQ